MILPSEQEKILKFKNYRFKEKVPFTIFADLECLLQQVPNTQLNTGPYQKHVPHSVAYYLHCRYDNSL